MQELSKERIGRFTASSIWKLMSGGKTRETYIFEKAEEIVYGHTKSFSNKHIEHGLENEWEGIQSAQEVMGELIEPLNQKYFPINKNCGATPDAKVVTLSSITKASLDIKCPTTTFFKQKMIQIRESKPLYQNVPKESYYQGQMQMMALSKENERLGHPPVKEHYLVRYLTNMEIDDGGNKIEYDLPLETRLFYKKITAHEGVQNEILKMVSEAIKERDLLVRVFMNPI